MKKLEPGCKAITVNCLVPENNGKIVTVLSIGEKELWEAPDGSLELDYVIYIDTDLSGYDGEIGNKAQACNLRRIGDREETATWEAMRDLWVPEQVKTVETSNAGQE